MNRRKVLLILIIVLITLTVSGAAVSARQAEARRVPANPAGQPMDSDHFQLDWNAYATGGGTVDSAHFEVSSTVGQPATGISRSSNFEVCSGFWCKVLAFFEINLPVINRNVSP